MASSGVLVVLAKSRTNVRSCRPRSSGLAIGHFSTVLTWITDRCKKVLKIGFAREQSSPAPYIVIDCVSLHLKLVHQVLNILRQCKLFVESEHEFLQCFG